nr:hypothetical protein [candidate division Zixibacteria bacterium]
MRKLLILASSLLLLTTFTFVGCGDDDDDPVGSKQVAMMFGQTALCEGYLYFYSYIFDIEGLEPDIDSILIEDEKAEIQIGYGEGLMMGQAHYEEDQGSLESGDDVTIEIYTSGGKSSCTVSLLDCEDDVPEVIGWASSSPYDTIDAEDPIEIDWHPVDNAEWYLVDYYYSYDSNGTHDSHDAYYATSDTFFTLAGTETEYNGYFEFNIVAINGPTPDASSGNITGEYVRGAIISYASDWFDIYVGTGDAWPSPLKPTDDIEHRDISKRLTEIYK